MMTSSVVKKANIAGDDVCSLENLACNPGHTTKHQEEEFGIFARRAMVDQAREGLCYQ